MNRAFEKELSRALATEMTQPHRKRCCAAAGRNMS